MSHPFPRSTAALAGALYLVIILCGVSGEALVRGALVVPGDAAATAANILDQQGLFRLGTLLDLAMTLADAGLAVALFVLLRPVSATLALAAMVFRLIQTAILGANLMLHHGALMTLTGGGEPSTALRLLEAHALGYDLGLVFLAVNCGLTAWLLWHAGAPRALAGGVGAAGVVYLTGSLLRIIDPGAAAAIAPAYLVPLLAESAFCLWLLSRALSGRGAARAA
jgi:hypothetical protein